MLDLTAPAIEHVVAVAATPSPSPTPGPNDDQVTPGVIGFVFTAVILVAAVLLIIDMVRRMRRVRYREEAREKIAAELDERLDD